jgi:hypothetical protein
LNLQKSSGLFTSSYPKVRFFGKQKFSAIFGLHFPEKNFRSAFFGGSFAFFH